MSFSSGDGDHMFHKYGLVNHRLLYFRGVTPPAEKKSLIKKNNITHLIVFVEHDEHTELTPTKCTSLVVRVSQDGSIDKTEDEVKLFGQKAEKKSNKEDNVVLFYELHKESSADLLQKTIQPFLIHYISMLQNVSLPEAQKILASKVASDSPSPLKGSKTKVKSPRPVSPQPSSSPLPETQTPSAMASKLSKSDQTKLSIKRILGLSSPGSPSGNKEKIRMKNSSFDGDDKNYKIEKLSHEQNLGFQKPVKAPIPTTTTQNPLLVALEEHDAKDPESREKKGKRKSKGGGRMKKLFNRGSDIRDRGSDTEKDYYTESAENSPMMERSASPNIFSALTNNNNSKNDPPSRPKKTGSTTGTPNVFKKDEYSSGSDSTSNGSGKGETDQDGTESDKDDPSSSETYEDKNIDHLLAQAMPRALSTSNGTPGTEITKYEQLPQDVKELVRKQISEKQARAHFDILLNVLHFLKKINLDWNADHIEHRKRVAKMDNQRIGGSIELIDKEMMETDFKGLVQTGEGGYGVVFSARMDVKHVRTNSQKQQGTADIVTAVELEITTTDKGKEKHNGSDRPKECREGRAGTKDGHENGSNKDEKSVQRSTRKKPGSGMAPSKSIKIAVKRMANQTRKDKRYNLSEVYYLSQVKHPNIVSYYNSLLVGKELWLVMEFMEGGTLTDAVKAHQFSEPQIAFVAHAVLSALSYLHSKHLAHRDLKSANVMMTIEGRVKLIDFGLCVDMSNGDRSDMVGSPFWMAPEMVQRRPHGISVDIWSFAVCLLELANSCHPFGKSALKAMFTYGVEGFVKPFKDESKWSQDMKDFVGKCLKIKPEERGTADQLLQDKWLQVRADQKDMAVFLRKIFVKGIYTQVLM